jgi:hypothetical protein
MAYKGKMSFAIAHKELSQGKIYSTNNIVVFTKKRMASRQ